MGCFQYSYTDSNEALHPQHSSETIVITSSSLKYDDFDDTDLETGTMSRNMIWVLGLACVLPVFRRRLRGKDPKQGEKTNGVLLDHNKAWLLAETAGSGSEESNADPQSVHSSFRFSFGSQVELDPMSLNSSSTTATVLMVNLDSGLRDGMVAESLSRDLKWRRLQSLERSISPVAATLVRFSYDEIRSATRNFSNGRVLGRGALSCVFRGRVGLRRTAVAIKRLDKEDRESAKAFCRELLIANSLHHQNVVPLVGFCIDLEGGLFLVYKFVSGGSLEHHLHGKKKGVKGCSSLSLSVRFRISMGIAEAIAYLHNGTEKCVVHRDIKPSNILLSSKKKPKLCDFGLATWTPAPSVPFLCKTVKGTFGYLAPEYFQHGKVSDKTDVYAFGVVLLELITGRKPNEARRPVGDENLVTWAKPLLEQGRGVIHELLDPRLKLESCNSNQITQMVQAAAACLTNEDYKRPGMYEVISILQGEQDYCSNRNKSSFASNSYVTDYYPHLQQTQSEMKSHLALAMLGVSELEDEDHLYCR